MQGKALLVLMLYTYGQLDNQSINLGSWVCQMCIAAVVTVEPLLSGSGHIMVNLHNRFKSWPSTIDMFLVRGAACSAF